MDVPFLYQLQEANYSKLEAVKFCVAVIDPDDSGLTPSQITALRNSHGKVLYAYTSIGEAEDYRSYWDETWDVSPPKFVLDENPQWDGNFPVAFWNAEWQNIVFDRVDKAIATGYAGIYLDIVDGYETPVVKDAYFGTDADLREEMVDFVRAISARAKAADPDFAIIPQNAVGLLSLGESRPESGPNRAYLNAIDGIGVEDLWYDGDTQSEWTQDDLKLIAIAQQANKFVLATSYPMQTRNQVDFIANAVSSGFIPFVTDLTLSGMIVPANAKIWELMGGRKITESGNDSSDKPMGR